MDFGHRLLELFDGVVALRELRYVFELGYSLPLFVEGGGRREGRGGPQGGVARSAGDYGGAGVVDRLSEELDHPAAIVQGRLE